MLGACKKEFGFFVVTVCPQITNSASLSRSFIIFLNSGRVGVVPMPQGTGGAGGLGCCIFCTAHGALP